MLSHRFWASGSLHTGLLFVLVSVGCDAGYDRSKLYEPGVCGDGRLDKGELCDTRIPSDQPGSCPKSCPVGVACVPNMLVGKGCSVSCQPVPITKNYNGDGCCLPDATPKDDSDCGSCGDKVVGPDETCDPPETCPTKDSCETRKGCVYGVLSGDPKLCTARCDLHEVMDCLSEDACCPPGCSSADDADCSSVCGNGTVDSSAGETCEVRSRLAPCPTSCDDDDPCTRDLMTGSGANCNVLCTHELIKLPTHGDGCCQPGSNAVNDNDCPSLCGNRVPEPGEECDGGDSCTTDCRVIPPAQHACMELPTAASAECEACSCAKCTQAMLNCYMSGNTVNDQRCSTVVECSNRTGCSGNSCFCGTSVVDCSAPDGPCETEITAAAESIYRNQVMACSTNEKCALYWSRIVGECRASECAAECMKQATPPPPTTPTGGKGAAAP